MKVLLDKDADRLRAKRYSAKVGETPTGQTRTFIVKTLSAHADQSVEDGHRRTVGSSAESNSTPIGLVVERSSRCHSGSRMRIAWTPTIFIGASSRKNGNCDHKYIELIFWSTGGADFAQATGAARNNEYCQIIAQ
jgi:hypothetical protein